MLRPAFLCRCLVSLLAQDTLTCTTLRVWARSADVMVGVALPLTDPTCSFANAVRSPCALYRLVKTRTTMASAPKPDSSADRIDQLVSNGFVWWLDAAAVD